MPKITADLTEGFQVQISNDNHNWRADEPIDVGGTDLGPTPYELLLGSVAACTAITLSMYARRKEIKIDSISVQYEYKKLHADDCEICDDDMSGYIDIVTSNVFIDGNFTEAQRKRLAQIAVRCPVHKTLEKGITFDDNIVVG